IEFRFRVIKIEAGSGRGSQSQLSDERLVAVVPAAQCDPFLIGECHQIMRVNITELETGDTRSIARGTKDAQIRNFSQASSRCLAKVMIVFLDRSSSLPFQIIKRCGQAYRAGNMRCPGFKPVGSWVPFCSFKSNAPTPL